MSRVLIEYLEPKYIRPIVETETTFLVSGASFYDMWVQPEIYDGVDDEEKIEDLLNSIGSEEFRRIYLRPKEWKFPTGITFPSNTTVYVEDGATLSASAGAIIRFEGELVARPHQIFNQVGEIRFDSDATKTIYPEWFGAVGDGSTDDSEAIQRAFDSMASGQTFFLSSKDYYVDDRALYVKRLDGLSFIGENKTTSRIILNQTTEVSAGIYVLSSGSLINDMRFENFCIGGRDDEENPPYGLISISTVNRLVVDSMYFKRARRYALNLSTIQESYFMNSKYHFINTWSATAASSGSVIQTWYFYRNYITDNEFINCNWGAYSWDIFDLTYWPEGDHLINFKGTGSYSCGENTISRNIISSTAFASIHFENPLGTNIYHTKITDNSWVLCYRALVLRDCSSTLVANNIFRSAPIYIHGQLDRCTILGNQFTYNRTWNDQLFPAITIEGKGTNVGTNNVQILGNTFHNFDEDCGVITFSKAACCSNVDIKGNIIHTRNDGVGIVLDGPSACNIRICDNEIQSDTTYAMRISAGAGEDISIFRNSIIGQGVGIRCDKSDVSTYRLYDNFIEGDVVGITPFPYRGKVTLSSGTADVVFPGLVADTTYRVFLTGNAAESFYYSSKATSGFTVNSSNGSSTAEVEYEVTMF